MADPSTDAMQSKWILSGVGALLSCLVAVVGWLLGDKVKSVKGETVELFNRMNSLERNVERIGATQELDRAHIRESLTRLESAMISMATRFDALAQAMCVPVRKGGHDE